MNDRARSGSKADASRSRLTDRYWPVSGSCRRRRLAYSCTELHTKGVSAVVSHFAIVADRLRSAGVSDREISELVVAMFLDQSSVEQYGTVGPRVAEWIGLMVTRAARWILANTTARRRHIACRRAL